MLVSRLFLTLLQTSSLLVVGKPAAHDEHVVLERRDLSSEWLKKSEVSSKRILPVRIALAQSNIHKGPEFLTEISDPASPKYGRHWTLSEVNAAFAPSADTVATTTKWLVDNGIHSSRIDRTKNRGYLAFDASAKELEDLFKTKYFTYTHANKGQLAIGCESYSVPSHIKKHIDHVTPGIGFHRIAKPREVTKSIKPRASCPKSLDPSGLAGKDLATNLTICNDVITPACVKALYDIPDPVSSHPNNSFAIFEAEASFVQSDMDLFFKYLAKNIPEGTKPQIDLINGAKLTRNASRVEDGTVGSFIRGLLRRTKTYQEANLDFQLAWPLVYPLNITLIESELSAVENKSRSVTAKKSKNEAQTEALLDLVGNALGAIDGSFCTEAMGSQCGVFNAPNVMSISYGADETPYSPAMENRLCNEFLKLGLQGTTVVVSSGDAGVEGQSRTCLGPNNSTFNTAALSSCPWVTVVGATQINKNESVYAPESAALAPSPKGAFSSGGGFSNYHVAPVYQQETISKYFYQSAPPYLSYEYNGTASIGASGGRFSKLGRAYPDVAANGLNILTISSGCLSTELGTSASAPIFASIITRINNERLMAGKSPVGFTNPTLYANPSILTDIVQGHNVGCGMQGFSVVTGWDPVTGLGTPSYPRMLELFMSLP